MEVAIHQRVQLTQNVTSGFSDREIPAGTRGTVVEAYREPEGYAVDLALPDASLVGGFKYENVVLRPGQFEVVSD
jgi:hypothetical protein